MRLLPSVKDLEQNLLMLNLPGAKPPYPGPAPFILNKLPLALRACALKRFGAQAGEGRGEGGYPGVERTSAY